MFTLLPKSFPLLFSVLIASLHQPYLQCMALNKFCLMKMLIRMKLLGKTSLQNLKLILWSYIHPDLRHFATFMVAHNERKSFLFFHPDGLGVFAGSKSFFWPPLSFNVRNLAFLNSKEEYFSFQHSSLVTFLIWNLKKD